MELLNTYTLKSFVHSPSLFEETLAFSAILCENGKKIALVSNRGHGGCTEVSSIDAKKGYAPIRLAEQKLGQEYQHNYFGEPAPLSLEILVDDLVQFLVQKKALRLSRSFVFTHPRVPRGQVGMIRALWGPVNPNFMEVCKQHIQKDFPGAVVLNGLSDAELHAALVKAGMLSSGISKVA